MNSMCCIRCYLIVIVLYTALELDVVIEHFWLTQTEGILVHILLFRGIF